jgi:hypothetical protein
MPISHSTDENLLNTYGILMLRLVVLAVTAVVFLDSTESTAHCTDTETYFSPCAIA